MTPDPLPVALPELPTPAWARDMHGETEVFTAAEMRSYATLVAEAALRAQAEEVRQLRNLLTALVDHQALATNVHQDLESFKAAFRKYNDEHEAVWANARAHLAASKQEKP